MLPAGLDILGRPKGENRIAHGLQPWEDGPERNRPERAAECRSLFPKITFVESDSMAFQKLTKLLHAQSDVKGTEPLYITAYIYVVVNAIRTPFQHLQPGGPGVFHRGNGFLVPAWSCFAKRREATRKLWQVIRLPNGV